MTIFRHVKAMSPVMVVVALLCCATSLPFNINYALTSSSRHYQLNADVLCVVGYFCLSLSQIVRHCARANTVIYMKACSYKKFSKNPEEFF